MLIKAINIFCIKKNGIDRWTSTIFCYAVMLVFKIQFCVYKIGLGRNFPGLFQAINILVSTLVLSFLGMFTSFSCFHNYYTIPLTFHGLSMCPFGSHNNPLISWLYVYPHLTKTCLRMFTLLSLCSNWSFNLWFPTLVVLGLVKIVPQQDPLQGILPTLIHVKSLHY